MDTNTRKALLTAGGKQTWQNIWLWGLCLLVIIVIVTFLRTVGLLLYAFFVVLTVRDFIRLTIYGVGSLVTGPTAVIMGVIREDEDLFSSGYYSLLAALANLVFLTMYVVGGYVVYRQASATPIFFAAAASRFI